MGILEAPEGPLPFPLPPTFMLMPMGLDTQANSDSFPVSTDEPRNGAW